MGTEQEQQGAGAAGGSGAGAGGTNIEAPRAGQAYGTASRAPLFPAPPTAGTQQEPGVIPPGGDAAAAQIPPRPGRGPVTTVGIPDAALKARLDRARAQGQEPFFRALGVKTEAEAKEKLAKLAMAEQEGEKRRLAELSEVERLKAELDAERQKNAALEQRLASHEQEREHEQHEQVVVRVAGEQVIPKALKIFRIDLAAHVKRLGETNPELAEKFNERGIKRFTDKWLRENPEFAKQAAPADAAAGEKPPVVVPPARGATPPTGARPAQPVPQRRALTTGIPPRKNPAPPVNAGGAAPPGTMNGKTARPGQPNSMSSAEVKQFAAQNGIRYNSM